MSARKLVQIGQSPKLPTVAEYFRDLALRQGEDIRLLKERAFEQTERRTQRAGRTSVREEGWRLHPVVPASKTVKKRTAAKKRGSTKPRSR